MGSAEACEVLDIDRSTLIRWVAKGRISPAQQLPGPNGAYIFDPAEVDRVLNEIGDALTREAKASATP